MVSANDVHRLFLQAVFSRRILTVQLAQTIWAKCAEAVKCDFRTVLPLVKQELISLSNIAAVNEDLNVHYSKDRAAWDNFVGEINGSLNSLDLEFRHLHDEMEGKEMYGLVSDLLPLNLSCSDAFLLI
jgi:hypothetical protein